ncbi:rubrerythrin [Desmospora activa DSM 45169]|uniref:Rubrerythrin n=1 Tax=Desmospora activa DSM 45169 TaxID=1121389 RepID=A0A2T4ZAW0_9BACL|nr:ferritin-like domain-containing protein [Desmospora activa]PTM59028.1 rubrerythrin [Desmospora activa DSM 45169]
MYRYAIIQQELDTPLITNIAQAINGEYSAIACYAHLATVAPTEEARKQIKEIRQDEVRHFQTFSAIYTRLTGRQPTPTITEPCPQSYKEGLDFAFKDEQETVDHYLDIADRARNPVIRTAFQRAAADEQNHAVWFLYLITKKSCSCQT